MIKKFVSEKSLYLTVTAVLVVVLGLYFVFKDKPEYKVERVLKYSFTVTNPTNSLVENSTLWAYVPVKKTSTQKFISVEASQDYRLISDDLGNQRLFFDLKNIAPYGSKVIAIKVHVNMSKKPNDVDVDDLQIYLGAEKYIESESDSIKKLAAGLLVGDEVETSQAIYSWVLENIEYKGFVSEDRGAQYAMDNASGDCTEYAYLVTALSRANKLPSRSVAGFVYSENAKLLVKDYHNWSEVLIDDSWWLVDAQKKVFMQQLENYIAMRIMVAGESDEKGNSQKYFHVESPLLAVMN